MTREQFDYAVEIGYERLVGTIKQFKAEYPTTVLDKDEMPVLSSSADDSVKFERLLKIDEELCGQLR